MLDRCKTTRQAHSPAAGDTEFHEIRRVRWAAAALLTAALRTVTEQHLQPFRHSGHTEHQLATCRNILAY